jgi:hypothetical protein
MLLPRAGRRLAAFFRDLAMSVLLRMRAANPIGAEATVPDPAHPAPDTWLPASAGRLDA